ncbi:MULTISPECIES: hypothetical protein [Rhodococcus]|uniref:Uncharacterized protein n=1 Tax=Rhodococcus oxybenzonivorans TaxID=1990687 RepID=A0AAE5A9C4_9NOCA|nr:MULTISPECIES: hypothetical protein [Rhodococcus]MDV7245172.1 hypothetical protein [Rhodococcus oxybenzonivorans]MDV7268058.1 hypothetical protein [Rhodococcus oxybenzonivorans]MDV7272546.1 hypothetical protein [Rhodococcus oxybenzonivorans]MDV7336197.1 hypothetical protein [Rhodococcus oxybenzonivorans]MDV7342882.1 hypothetical protein [Rhodococcus oxybenzonivorans]
MEDTASRGIQAFIADVTERGGKAVRLTHSRRNPVQVWGDDGQSRIVRVRSKLSGDWQARKQDESLDDDDTGSQFWVFVDLASEPHEFFVVPSAEVADDIRAEVDLWMMDTPGRTRTGHHAIPLSRVAHGRGRWDLLGLSGAKDPSLYSDAQRAKTAEALHADALARTNARKKPAKAAALLDEVIDTRLEVVADFEGYRLVGRFDSDTHSLEIVRGPMQGRRFPDPTTAASAVASHISGDVETHDGWSFWRTEQGERIDLRQNSI